MPHHFVKSTVESSIFCPTCMKMTPWKVADGRRQYCTVCYEKRQAKEIEKPHEDTQGKLF